MFNGLLGTTTPNDHGYTNSPFWSTRILASLIEQKYNVVYSSRTSYYVMFKKASFSFHLPGKQYEKADAEVVAAWKKEQHERLEEAFSDPDTVILCEDEMVLTQATTTQKVWIPQGTSPAVIETNGTRKNRSIYGFLNLKTGQEQPEEAVPSSATECDLSSNQQSAKEFNQVVITDEDGQLRLSPEVPFVIGDSAYGGFDTRADLANRGIGILSRVPTPHNRDGKFSKDAFHIDTANQCVTCPAGNVVAYKVSHLGQGAVSFGTSCATCPLKERCTTSKSGRTIRIHRYQAELERLRAQQRDPVFLALYNHYRSFAERMNAQLVKVLHGGRKSRYIGLEKSQFCISQRAASVNLSRISKLLVT